LKKNRRSYLDDMSQLSPHYALIRELYAKQRGRQRDFRLSNIMTWPAAYGYEVINAAVELVVGDYEKRLAGRAGLYLEVDGIEILEENTLGNEGDEFEILKDERDGLDSGFHTQNTMPSNDDAVYDSPPDMCIFVEGG
jgi:hypothetical protein